MESVAESKNVQEESATQVAGYEKRRGFATAKGEEYEVALCSLLYLRALRHASDFFLASNHDVAGIFDDVVLIYRLKGDQGHVYRAILLQAKHKERITQKKLTLSNPFALNDYLASFNVVKNLWEHPMKVGNLEIQLQDITLVLYTNTSCDIGNEAVDITENQKVQHLHDLLNTGGRLLQISEEQGRKLFKGNETSDFLTHLLLCIEQASVRTVDSFLEQELSNLLKLKSTEVARNLISELKRVVKDWWSKEGTVSYLTADSKKWMEILDIQVKRLNGQVEYKLDKLNINFTPEALKQFDVIRRPFKTNWICVIDEYQAKTVKSRLFRAQRNSLVVDFKFLVDHLEEIEAVWGKKICRTLVIDMFTVSPEEGSLMLRRLQEAVQSDWSRHLVVVAKGMPPGVGWSEVEAEPTWSVLHHVTRDRLMSAPVRLQGKSVQLRDVLGSHVNNVMTDEVITVLCEHETEIKLGETPPEALEYHLPRCLERTSENIVNFNSLQNKNILIFSSSYLLPDNEFIHRSNTLTPSNINNGKKVTRPTFVRGETNDYEKRQLCCRFRARGISGEISNTGITNNVTEYIPLTWMCEDNIVVIEGLPGVGKSSFVTMMCFNVKEQFPESWVLRIDMGRQTDYIKDTDLTEVSEIKELLLKSLPKDANNLERQLLEHALCVMGNVFLFFDAFDEISPDYTRKCCDLLKGIAQTIRYRQMVVTTRPVTTTDVEDALLTKAFTLPVFSDEEQVVFLKQFTVAKGKNVVEHEISSLRDSAGPVLEIPLLCRMAAEVFLHRREEIFLKCLNPWRRVLLYELFVEQSIKERVAEKLGVDTSRPVTKSLLESHKSFHLQNLQVLAVTKLLPLDELPLLSVSTVTPEEKLGLVVNTGGSVDFEHKTYAEYFLGCWLACHWQRCPRKLLRDVFFRDGFEFAAATLSWSLFDGFPLHLAVAQGDVDAVSKHLSSPGITDRGGRTALHVAAMTRSNPRALGELLMASGEDLIKSDDVLGITTVKYAQIFRNWEFIQLIIVNGKKLRSLKFLTDKTFTKEALLEIIKEDLTVLMQYLFCLHQGLSNQLDNVGNTLMHMAAAYNSKCVIKLLIEMRCKIDATNKNRITPLHEASIRGHVEAVTLLVDHGADLNIKNENGSTALIIASQEGHLEVVKILLQNGAGLNIKTDKGATALYVAAYGGHLEVVKVLLENEADLNMRTEGGFTPLYIAAFKDHLEIVEILLEKGADLNVNTEKGETALVTAAREGHLEVVKVLLENGADLLIITEGGFTPLIIAAQEGHLEVVKILLQNGADLNIKTENGFTALYVSAFKGNLDVVKVLLQNGADLNIKTENGCTALYIAAGEGHLNVVKILLQHGADINEKTEGGHTPLYVAAFKGHLDVVTLLLQIGADLNIMAENGHTALTIAVRKGHQEVVELLTIMEVMYGGFYTFPNSPTHQEL